MSNKWVSEFKFKGTGVLRSRVSGILQCGVHAGGSLRLRTSHMASGSLRMVGRTGDKSSCLRHLPCAFIPLLRLPGGEVWAPIEVRGGPIEAWNIADVV